MKMSPPRLTRNRLPPLSSPKDAIWLSVPASSAKSPLRRAKREDARVSPGTRHAQGTVQILPDLQYAKTYLQCLNEIGVLCRSPTVKNRRALSRERKSECVYITRC